MLKTMSKKPVKKILNRINNRQPITIVNFLIIPEEKCFKQFLLAAG